MPIYFTVKQLAEKFPNPRTGKPKCEKTILRWRKKKVIEFDGQMFVPVKEPSGRGWKFKVLPVNK